MSGTGTTWDPTAATLLAVGRLPVAAGWSHRPHAHGYHQLMLVLGGDLAIEIAGAPGFRARAGDYVHYALGREHAERAGSRGADFVHLAFLGAMPAWPATAADASGRGRQLVIWLVEERRNPQERATAREGALLRLLLEEFHHAASRPLPAFVTAVRAHLVEHLAEPISLADLAAVAAMSPVHFGRRYRTATGLTPMADLRRRRVAAAHDLLVATDLPLKAIAARCGFCDEYHLSKVCRRALGHPPGFYRAGTVPSG
jgi:AraC-like DNA-binding protein